jgi:hypothetical protein
MYHICLYELFMSYILDIYYRNMGDTDRQMQLKDVGGMRT